MSFKAIISPTGTASNSLTPLWNEYLLNGKPPHQSTRFRFSPSGIAGCRRKLFYNFVLAPKDGTPKDPRTERIFDIGSAAHEMVQAQLLAAGVFVSKKDIEVGFFNRYRRVKGFIDGIVTIDGERIIFEFKTINDKGFKALKNGPKDDHIEQVHLYMLVTGLEKAIVLYFNKNDSNLMEFTVERDEDEIDLLKRKMTFIIKCVVDGVLPRRKAENVNSWHCTFCDYKKTCHKKGALDWDEIQSEWGKIASEIKRRRKAKK